jgi:hypothetical protein
VQKGNRSSRYGDTPKKSPALHRWKAECSKIKRLHRPPIAAEVINRTAAQSFHQPFAYPALSAYVTRGEACRAFKRAFDAQLVVFNSAAPVG